MAFRASRHHYVVLSNELNTEIRRAMRIPSLKAEKAAQRVHFAKRLRQQIINHVRRFAREISPISKHLLVWRKTVSSCFDEQLIA